MKKKTQRNTDIYIERVREREREREREGKREHAKRIVWKKFYED